jgi:hypothetical protein
MAKVLTTGSDVKCAHGGSANPSSSAQLKVGGNPVACEANVTDVTLSSCGTPTTPPPQGPKNAPCSKVKAVSAGQATKLMAGGKPVMLDTLAGTTDGTVSNVTPQPGLSASANQSMLTAT